MRPGLTGTGALTQKVPRTHALGELCRRKNLAIGVSRGTRLGRFGEKEVVSPQTTSASGSIVLTSGTQLPREGAGVAQSVGIVLNTPHTWAQSEARGW